MTNAFSIGSTARSRSLFLCFLQFFQTLRNDVLIQISFLFRRPQFQVGFLYHIAFAKDDRPLNGIFQFANISWKVVSFQYRHRIMRKTFDFLAQRAGKFVSENDELTAAGLLSAPATGED